METIIPFLRSGGVFEPQDIVAMSTALNEVSVALGIVDAAKREAIAVRIIELARRGERSPTKLRDRVLNEAAYQDR